MLQLARAELDYERGKPVISILEKPVPPLQSSNINRWSIVFIWAFMGGIVSLCYIFIEWIYKNKMTQDQKVIVGKIIYAFVPKIMLTRFRHLYDIVQKHV